MNIDVAKAIKELLFEQNTVILPGLGGFTSTPISATVDYVKGAVQPPAKKLEFNTNLVTNDGVLVNYLQQSNLITAQDATVAIENYVAGIKEGLESREIIEIPEVGRLYKDYEQKTRFMPDSTNFEVDSFGLPTVKFNPVTRPKKEVESKATSAKSVPPAPPPKKITPTASKQGANSHWAEKILPTLIIVAAILLALSLFIWLRGCDSGQPQANVPQERVNVKPQSESVEDEVVTDEDEMTTSTDEDEITTTDMDESDPATTSTDIDESDSATSSGQTEEEYSDGESSLEEESSTVTNIFVVVHSFGKRNNARRFSKKLEDGGYIATTKKRGGLYRVGVEVPSTRKNEIESLIYELGREYDAKPVVVDY